MAVTDVFGVAILQLFRAVVAEATLLFDTSSSYRTIHNMVYTNLIWKRLNFNIFIIMKSLFLRKWGLIQLNSTLDKHFKIWFFMVDVWDLFRVHFFWIRLYSRIMTSWNVQLSCLNSANLIITLTAIVLLYQLFHS